MAIFAFLDANANSEKNNIPRTTKLFQVYTPSDYSLGPQNRVILQHSNGLIYVGNNDGLLEFDGIEWRKYSIPDYNVWSIGEDSRGRLYIGGSNGRIGYMKPDSIGKLTYAPLNHDIKLGAIYDITSIGDTVYFHTQYTLLQWDGSSLHTLIADTAKLYPQKNKKRYEIFPGFSVNGKAVVRENRRQLKQIHKNNLLPLKYGLFEKDLKVHSILPLKDKFLLASNKKGFWLYGKDGLTNIHPHHTVESQSWTIYNGVLLPDSTVAYATKNAGIVFFDPNYGITDILDKSDGLPSNKCINITTDSEGNIWAAMEGGIVKIGYGLAVNIMGPPDGLDGIVRTTIRFNERMYAATSLGLQVRNEQSGKWVTPANFPLEFTGQFVWDFLQINNTLLIATSSGVLLTNSRDNKFRKLEGLSNEAYFSLLQSHIDPYRIYTLGRNIISSIYYDDGEWLVEQNALANIPAKTTTFAEDNSGRLWLASSVGVYTIEPNLNRSDLSSLTPAKPQKVSLSLPSSNAYAFILRIEDSVYVSNADSTFVVNHENGQLEPTYSFKGIEKVFNEKWTQYLAPDLTTIWWHSKGQYLKSAFRDGVNNRYLLHPLNSLLLKQVNDVYFEEKMIWLSTSSGVISYKINRTPFHYPDKRPMIRRLEEIDSETLRENLTTWPQQAKLLLSSDRNNLKFSVADAAYIGNRDTEFQFRLSPQSTNWSNWTTEPTRDYTFLHHGEYTFSVRMRNDFDQVSEPVHYSFEILPPWYLHPLAYFFYFIAGIFSLIGMVIYSRKRGFAKAEKVYLKRELQSAVEIQRTLIPDQFPELDGFSLAGYFSPASDVGGDYYDAILVENGKSMLISLADIEGKRMAGAVPATLLNGLLNGVIGNKTPKSLVEIALRIDSLFYSKLKGKRRVAILMAMLQKNGNNVRLFNAGCHLPLFLSNGQASEIRSDDLLNAPLGNGMAERGLSSLAELNEHRVLVNAGESLILYSDGVRELKDSAGNKLFPKLLENTQVNFGDKDAPEIVRIMVDFINQAKRDGASQTDDITFIVIQRNSG